MLENQKYFFDDCHGSSLLCYNIWILSSAEMAELKQQK